MDRFKYLVSKCKGSVQLSVNDHKDDYSSVMEYIDALFCPPYMESGVLEKMIETNTVVCLHFYPHSPVGFYEIYHYDIDMALDLGIKFLKEELNEQAPA